ncbi:alcohol dehydrogenase catalytic domain-containing protein, partial [Salibacterium qingdaonense]
MKAVQVTGYGDVDKLEFVERKAPEPKRDEVLINVKACGINNTEIWMREGAYGSGGKSGWRPEGVQFPRIPGSDITGCIEKTGEEVDESLIVLLLGKFDRLLLDRMVHKLTGSLSGNRRKKAG